MIRGFGCGFEDVTPMQVVVIKNPCYCKVHDVIILPTKLVFFMNAEVDGLQSVDVEDMMVPPVAPKLREDFKSLGGMVSRLESESSYKDWRVRLDGEGRPYTTRTGGLVEAIFVLVEMRVLINLGCLCI